MRALRTIPALSAEVTAFDGTAPRTRSSLPVGPGVIEGRTRADGSEWGVAGDLRETDAARGAWEGRITFTVLSGALAGANVAVRADFAEWAVENYVMMPAAAYNGNRYRSLPKPYPPMLHEEDGIGPEMPVTITDVPRLTAEGPSLLHFRSGDMATPCVGIHSPGRREGFLLLGEHDTPVGYTGVSLEESADRRSAFLRLEAPAVRRTMYLHCRTGVVSDDAGHDFRSGDSVTLRFSLHLFPCADIAALFARFLEARQELSGGPELRNELPFSAAFRLIEGKYQAQNWNERYGYYRVDVVDNRSRFGDWQAGWVGGGMSSLAFLADGVPLARERARKTLDAVFGPLQAPSGFVYPMMADGTLWGDDFCHQEKSDILLIRKDADVLLFGARQILLLQKRGEQVPQAWLDGLGRLADAFVRLWDRHGQLGQFVDLSTDRIVIGGTACGSSAPGGLALAARILGKDRYLEVAAASARHYCTASLSRGLLNGGPGEILQCADSESAFNLLESLVTLYETTGEAAWLAPAEECARLCSSWCVSYDFHFPEGSAFGELDMRSTGSVFASIQNKHSAPGICTLSGVSLLKLYRATGDERYLRLCREIAHNLTQYLSREDRPIRSVDGRSLRPGWMCERVNMCDWETKRCVGGVFYGSNWCEVSCLLTYTELPGVWMLTDTGEAVVFDHVEARVSDAGSAWRLQLRNPTAFDAEVKVYAEPRSGFGRPWGEWALEGCPTLHVPARGSVEVELPRSR